MASKQVILELPFFGREFSRYRDNGHYGGLFADFQISRARLTLGGSLAINSGSRPTRYYVPRAAIVVPAGERIRWVAEWRWYGFGEEFFRYEDFRTHTFSTGLQIEL